MTPAQVAHIMSLVDQLADMAVGRFGASGRDRYYLEKRAAVEAALRDAPQAEGWVMVPVEPTPEMIEAGRRALRTGEKMWPAMLSARPSAPTAEKVPSVPTWFEECLSYCCTGCAPTAEPVRDESFCAIGYEPEPMEQAGAIGLVAMSIPQPSAPAAVEPAWKASTPVYMLAAAPTPTESQPAEADELSGREAFEAVYADALKSSKPGTIKDIARLCYVAALSAPTAPAQAEPVAAVRVENGMMRGATRRPGMATLPDGDHELYATPPATATATEPSDAERLDWNTSMKCVQAMLGCTSGELECIGEKLLDTYIDDVNRVYAAIRATKGGKL